jgi:hypothetical protein
MRALAIMLWLSLAFAASGCAAAHHQYCQTGPLYGMQCYSAPPSFRMGSSIFSAVDPRQSGGEAMGLPPDWLAAEPSGEFGGR